MIIKNCKTMNNISSDYERRADSDDLNATVTLCRDAKFVTNENTSQKRYTYFVHTV